MHTLGAASSILLSLWIIAGANGQFPLPSYTQPCPECQCMHWTGWINVGVSKQGDLETLRFPKNGYGTYITDENGYPGSVNRYLAQNGLTCNNPIEIECRDVATSQPFHQTFYTSPNDRTISPRYVKCTTDQGLICRNSEQQDGRCRDYEVRLLCWQKCDHLRWSAWRSVDTWSGVGDFEGHQLGSAVPLQYEPCPNGASPFDIQCRRRSDSMNAILTGQKNLLCDRNWGFSCVNSNQGAGNHCDDYEVSYLCRF